VRVRERGGKGKREGPTNFSSTLWEKGKMTGTQKKVPLPWKKRKECVNFTQPGEGGEKKK